ncbi:unnamed protein product [Onchocerca flexuosa]|uniref:Uncharacterized protein n=1 Tax=Onchocerca flexuosa TaxID=387005 RepID=A0A183I8E2_9BILA|nr:unnamed protein product [Onchocerca flexuosa]
MQLIEVVDGTFGREILRFSPFIAHICSTLCIFIIFFCCKRSDGRKRIVSLEDIAPPPAQDAPDDLKLLYPAAMRRDLKSQEPTEETELNARTIAICLDELQHATV